LNSASLLTKNLGFGAVVYTVMLVIGMLVLSLSDSYRGLGILLVLLGGMLLLARIMVVTGK
jgi:hypothetical protein